MAPDLEEEVSRAFNNINDVILYTLDKADHPASKGSSKNGWDRIVKLRTYHVKLPETREKIIEIMVRNIKKWCSNHHPTWTMIGLEALAFVEQNVEMDVDIYLG